MLPLNLGSIIDVKKQSMLTAEYINLRIFILTRNYFQAPFTSRGVTRFGGRVFTLGAKADGAVVSLVAVGH